nr:MAG TPA: hypothetical protein [Caudoviricetes sp.]
MFYHKFIVVCIILIDSEIQDRYKFQRNHRKGASCDAPFSFYHRCSYLRLY